jgi:hypothetical protein
MDVNIVYTRAAIASHSCLYDSLEADMKFGKNLSVQQAKHTDLRFLDYKDLKKMIKLDPSDPQFEVTLQAEIEAVNESFSLHVSDIQETLVHASQYAPAASSSISSRLREIMHVADKVEVLRRFAVWNAVGVVKILKKRTKALAGPSPPGLGDSGPVALEAPPTCPTETWLSKQLFFSGSDFAELQASLDSIAEELTRERLAELSGGGRLAPELQSKKTEEISSSSSRCPICLEQCVDAVELSTCGHRICWKCCVLGPIAFAPGEYRLSRCSVCRNEQPLDPTRNFKTVCSNKLKVLSELVEDDESVEFEDSGMSLDVLYGTASGGTRSKMESEKERQTMESIDACPISTFFCSLCCEPLLLEAISTTPCKHFFHRVCLEKHAEPHCPLCSEPLPIQLVTSRFLYERLTKLAETTPCWFPSPNQCPSHSSRYTDTPCVHCKQFNLQNLPPQTLLGANGLTMPSYLHVATVRVLQEESQPEGASQVYFGRNGEVLESFSQQLIDEKLERAQNFTLLK